MFPESAAASRPRSYTRERWPAGSTEGEAQLASAQRGAVGARSRSQEAGELRPRRHVELSEHLAEVIIDGARADEQLRGDFAVRRSGCGEVRHPRFLGR